MRALGGALEQREASATRIKDLGHLTINSSGIYYVFPEGSDLFQLGRKFTYNFDRQGSLHLKPTDDRTGYRVCRHHTKDGWCSLQMARRDEPEFGVFRGPRGRSQVLSIEAEADGWYRLALGDQERPPVIVRGRKPRSAEAAPPAKADPGVQGFRERLRAAQDVLNAAKAELGDDMQMRVDAEGQLRVVVMLEI